MTTPRRTGNLVKCRGMLVNTDVVIDALSAIEGVGQFQIMFARDERAGAMDELIVRIEHLNASSAAAAGLLREQVIARVRAAVSLRPEVEFVPRAAIYDHERSMKAKLVVDLRG